MPPSDEQYLVPADKLKNLSEARTSWEGSGFSLGMGIFVPSLVNAMAAGPDDEKMRFWNAIAAAAGATAAAVLLVISLQRKTKFSTQMDEITGGNRYTFDVAAGQYVDSPPKTPTAPKNPISRFFSWLARITA